MIDSHYGRAMRLFLEALERRAGANGTAHVTGKRQRLNLLVRSSVSDLYERYVGSRRLELVVGRADDRVAEVRYARRRQRLGLPSAPLSVIANALREHDGAFEDVLKELFRASLVAQIVRLPGAKEDKRAVKVCSLSALVLPAPGVVDISPTSLLPAPRRAVKAHAEKERQKEERKKAKAKARAKKEQVRLQLVRARPQASAKSTQQSGRTDAVGKHSSTPTPHGPQDSHKRPFASIRYGTGRMPEHLRRLPIKRLIGLNTVFRPPVRAQRLWRRQGHGKFEGLGR